MPALNCSCDWDCEDLEEAHALQPAHILTEEYHLKNDKLANKINFGS